MQKCKFTKGCLVGGLTLESLNLRKQISYVNTIPTRDLLPEPEGEGNKSHVARGGVA